jgi:ferrous iron transport protein A
MMPLSLAEVGEVNVIKKVSGRPEIKQHLENMGFVVGSNVTVISEVQGNIIVNVKNVRVAIGKDMANKIMI